MGEYYVYVYLDPRKSGEFIYGDYKFSFKPFYIGKGKKDRLYAHLKTRKASYKRNTILAIKKVGLQPVIFKVLEQLDEITALKEERNLINNIGLNNLTNVFDDTLFGFQHGKTYQEIYGDNWEIERNKRLNVLRENAKQNTEKMKLFGPSERHSKSSKKNWEDARKKAHLVWKGQKHSDETKSKISIENSIKQKGNLNSQYGTCWITKDNINKKIKKEELEKYNNQGWAKGRI